MRANPPFAYSTSPILPGAALPSLFAFEFQPCAPPMGRFAFRVCRTFTVSVAWIWAVLSEIVVSAEVSFLRNSPVRQNLPFI